MIIQNTTGNKVGAQMLSATDGSAFTSQVTVYVTIDAGTQTIGSVGSGLCTHEGNGYHTYAPSKGESNGSLLAFTFIGTGAIPVTKEYETVSAATSLALSGSTLSTRTGQYLLDLMEVLNQELQLQPGEANVTRGLTALNVAQDYFEALAAIRPRVLGSTTGTLTTTASTESTAFPYGVMRIDRLQVLDSNSRPVVDLYPYKRVGGHAASSGWPLNLVSYGSAGYPRGYEMSGGVIWWEPLPDATYTIRWYGFQSANDITASGTFAYPDAVALPLAAFAVRLLKVGVDDPAQDISSLAVESFKPLLDTLSLFNRDGATGFEYTQIHDA